MTNWKYQQAAILNHRDVWKDSVRFEVLDGKLQACFESDQGEFQYWEVSDFHIWNETYHVSF